MEINKIKEIKITELKNEIKTLKNKLRYEKNLFIKKELIKQIENTNYDIKYWSLIL